MGGIVLAIEKLSSPCVLKIEEIERMDFADIRAGIKTESRSSISSA